MFKLARRLYLREIFSGGSGCTGDCGQGRRCTCDPDREESAGKPSNRESKLPIGKTMTHQDIINMAVEVGATGCATPDKWGFFVISYTSLERFARLVAAHEREECVAIVLDNSDAEGICCTDDVLEAFRQRGEK